MARITFVYPDFESLGVEYLMAVCSEAGHEVHLVYYEAEDAYLGKRKSPAYDEIADRICQTHPAVVAFSCVTDNYQHQLQCSIALKRKSADVCTIFGGIHPTAVPEKTLCNDAIDAVAVGEAEHALLEFLEACASNGGFSLPDAPVAGFMFKKNGFVIGTPAEGKLADLDRLPFPKKEPFLSILKDACHEYRIMTSRGCPYRCSYCFNSQIVDLRGKNSIRRRSVDNVIAELAWAKERFSTGRILFVDDSFTTSKSWLSEFCDRYRREISLPFACIANPHYVDQEIAHMLAAAGCINVQLGVQSLSETLCAQTLERKSSNARIAEAIEHLKRNRIMVQVDHMLGIPGDTVAIQEDNARFYNRYRPDLISIFWLTYYPRTTIVELARKKGAITEKEIESIEEGVRLTTESYLTGGSLKDPAPYYSVAFLLNWMPLLPRWSVTLLLNSRLYRLFKVRSYYLSTALPRVIGSLLNKRDFRGRSHLIRFVQKTLGHAG
ncbi:cobalamin-dependent protein [Geomonas sp. Red69]|uniref:B12-binding domain-containing radical SAM protein n=1 Tax=Geomonas diazotrophica TaxID=2843197 RepID=UPI001C113A10|nr:cobalamin-dependent protein [Geomonas diazotrophica]MBU5635193.1 cobalamin-dependent protein [Geomonas diazotrophica]